MLARPQVKLSPLKPSTLRSSLMHYMQDQSVLSTQVILFHIALFTLGGIILVENSQGCIVICK